MIYRFREVVPEKLYRGSAPSPQDVRWLKDNKNIKKIVSLDEKTGEIINDICQELNIKHIKLYIDFDRKTLLNFLAQNLHQVFLTDMPVFVHCAEGRDRTGLACAMVQCKYLNVSPGKAIQEAKSLGFGEGLPTNILTLYEKIIRSCKPSKDNNSADDIVSNERSYIGDNRDSYLDEAHQGSFAPFLDPTRQFPYDIIYSEINDQSPTRENYDQNISLRSRDTSDKDAPLNVGIYNNDAGIFGVGPSINSGGFIYN